MATSAVQEGSLSRERKRREDLLKNSMAPSAPPELEPVLFVNKYMITKIDQKPGRFIDEQRSSTSPDPIDYRRHEDTQDPLLKRDNYYQNFKNNRFLYNGERNQLDQDISLDDPRRIQKI